MLDRNTRKIILTVAAHSSASILGPMLFFGVLGFFLDKKLESSPKFLLINIGIAFVLSNILLFRKRNFTIKKGLFKNNLEKASEKPSNQTEEKKKEERFN